ncbi:MAG: tungstate ABC transporter ATP-binding protein WtpC [Eubacteriales bacterium]|nr:tungstate ABC transporter ATP-binding protein WtpC [Eubacteriales bacterium]
MINIRNVYKQLGDFSLKNINLSIDDNEYYVLVGPTGAGKTVILEIISGMYKPDSGNVWINGRNVTSEYPEERHIGFVYQDYMLFPNLDVRENITFALKLQKIPQKSMNEKLEEITAMLNIKDLLERHPATLSGGEQQRVALARALIAEPKVLLLDEPLSALDPQSKELFQQDLKSIHHKTKTTTIHITHDFNEAYILADRIGVMCSGELVQTGTPFEVFQRPTSQFVAEFLGMENIYSGEVVNGSKVQLIRIGSVSISGITNLKGKVRVAIRPEDIIISREKFSSSARNTLNSRIIKIVSQGPFVKLILDAGITLAVLVTKQALEEMDLKVGQSVWAIFKSTAVHIF